MDLAVSYRPFAFDEVIGQEALVTTLKGSVASPSGTYGLFGPTGTGKTTLGRVFAAAINCLGTDDAGHACSRATPCLSCAAVMSGAKGHPDVIEVNGASLRGIEDARDIERTANYMPSGRSRFKVFIIDEFHQLTSNAQDCLLKILEEPPKTVVFILCTTNPEKLKPAILSRCQKLTTSLLSDENMTTLLRGAAVSVGFQAPAELVTAIVEASGGYSRHALKEMTSAVKRASLTGGVLDASTLASMVKSIQASSPVMRAYRYVYGLITKDGNMVFPQAASAESKTRFVEDVVEILRGLIHAAVGAEFLVNQNPHAKWIQTRANGNAAAHLLPHLPMFTKLFDEHVQALATLRTYSMPERDVLDGVAARSFLVR